LGGTNGGTLSATSSVVLINSILANSSNGSGAIADLVNARPATIANGAANIATATTTADAHDIVMSSSSTPSALTADPHLNPLAYNGGPTKTFSLCHDSAAVDAGNPAAAGLPSTDQRGPGY